MIVRATAYYAKVLGNPVPAYDKTKKEWTIDLCFDDETVEKLTGEGMDRDYLRNKGDERGYFFTYRRPELRKDGSPATPIKVVDDKGQPWPSNKLIGNGSTVNVMIAMNQAGKKGLKPSVISLQVWDHVPYEGSGSGFPTKEDGSEDWSEEENV